MVFQPVGHERSAPALGREPPTADVERSQGWRAKAPEVKPLGQRPLSELSVGFPPPVPATALRVEEPLGLT
jgi:hypothetical protein